MDKSTADSEVEGVTAFPSPCEASYRYVISLKSEKVNIWLEDRASKKQWQTGFLSKENYVTAANVFVDASAADYVSCFKQCLDCSMQGNEEAQRKLTPGRNGKLKLELGFKIRLLLSARSISYQFELQPVAVERIDILESKMKDQQEELEQLRRKLDEGGGSISLYVESIEISPCVAGRYDDKEPSILQWKSITSDNFQLGEDKTSVVVLRPGLYAVGALVNHVPSMTSDGLISLQKDDVGIQRAATGAALYRTKNLTTSFAAHHSSTSIVCLAQVQKGATISIVYGGTSPMPSLPSYLTLVRIGA